MVQKVLIVLAVMAGPAWGQVYKCVEGGQVIFSDQPCRSIGTAVTVKPAAGYAPPGGRVETGRDNKVDQNLVRQGNEAMARMQAAQEEAYRRREIRYNAERQINAQVKRNCERARADASYHAANTKDTGQLNYGWHYDQLRDAKSREASFCD